MLTNNILPASLPFACGHVVYGAAISIFCVFKDGAGQGKWMKETAENSHTRETANQTTASVSGSIRQGKNRHL